MQRDRDEGTGMIPPLSEMKLAAIEATIGELIDRIDPEPAREGLQETPARAAKAWSHWTEGYRVDVPALFKHFEDGAAGYAGIVLETGIPIYSHCEHHLAPIFGEAHVAYLPDDRVVGLSKLVRVTDAFARRLQVQERMTTQIADALVEGLHARGVAVILQCRHLCMESRGINRPGIITTTSAMRGVFFHDAAARAELLSLIQQRSR